MTHGPLGVLLLPWLLVGLLLLLDRLRPPVPPRTPTDPRRLLGLAYLGCLTHPFLDWLNTYGVRLLAPFDGRWFYGDALFIVDPWLWLLLGGTAFLAAERRGGIRGWVVLAALASLVVLSAGERVPAAARVVWLAGLGTTAALGLRVRGAGRPNAVAAVGLVLAGLYIGTMIGATTAASRWTRAELARRGIDGVGRLMVGPHPADPTRWDVVAETEAHYNTGTFRWTPRPRLDLGPQFPRPGSSEVIEAALAAPQVRGTVRWMRFPVAEVEESADGFTVHFLDTRYVRSRTRAFGSAVVRLDPRLHVKDGQSGR